MEKVTPFDIPLLINEICQYLSREDLKHCMLVSKAWAAWFASVLWRDLDCGRKTPDIPTLRRQQEHIQIVRNISMRDIRDSGERLPFSQLRRLEFKNESSEDGAHFTEIRVLPLLEGVTSLQHLKITLSLEHDSICRQFIRTLELLPHLQSLSLGCKRFIDGKVIQDILRVCHRLERLSLRFSGSERHATQEDRQGYMDTRAEIERMPEMRLCELSFRSDSDLVMENIHQPLLERCPRLERLDLGRIYQESILQHLSKALKDSKLPKLRHLNIKEVWEVHLQEALADALRHVECGLESLVFRASPSEPVIQSLVQYHSRMTKLDFSGYECYEISLWDLSDLMAGLPNLRSFESKVNDDDDHSSRDIPLEKHWECVSLKNLRLYLRLQGWGCNMSIKHVWEGSSGILFLDYLFSELAKLTRLQELFIECGLRDLFLKRHGYLTRLADLKQIKVFKFGEISDDQESGKEEALWMFENWPRLLEVHTPQMDEFDEGDGGVEFEGTTREESSSPHKHVFQTAIRDDDANAVIEGDWVNHGTEDEIGIKRTADC
ncbi:MAG: hypothetical protein J3Q66DRAFT_397632 [Benniella sp.]|nr:MAG: hypothetical protein J3Q66DRAFT_397632 [Benniella sp.]